MDLSDIDESWLIPDAGAEAPLKKFAPEEMLTCDSCLRANPPTRAQCLYCGDALNQPGASPATEVSTPSGASRGNNYVVVAFGSSASNSDKVINQLAARFRLKPSELRIAFTTDAPLPFVAAGSLDEARRIAGELADIGIESAAIAEADLKTSVHVNIRAVEFADNGVTAISTIGRERLFCEWTGLALIVTGRLLTNRVEVDERRSGGSVKPLDRRELSYDQSVIDLYAQSSDSAWRVMADGFDFSCLGEHKSLTTFDNVKALIQLLMDRSNAELNDSYARTRPVLASVWPLQSTASQGRSRRPRAGRKEFSTVTASNNETQFNNYSRLVWHLKLRQLSQVSDS